MTNIAVISGSHRQDGNSHKVADHIVAVANACQVAVNAYRVDISEVPLWDEGKWGTPDLSAKWAIWSPISDALKHSDALIIVSPEYCGMASPKITNFLLIASSEEVGHKPALPVTVSASRGGAYPIAQLRAFSAKNNHLCWVPDQVIVRDVENYLQDVQTGKESYTSKMMHYAIRILIDYAHALATVRRAGNIDYQQFPFGM
jgi:azobenzene reductase